LDTRRPADGHEGDFKLLVSSQDNIKILVNAYNILPMGDMRTYNLSMEIPTEQLVLQPNSCCSKWADVGNLVQSQDVDAVDSENEFVNEAFLASLEKCKR